MAESRRVQVTTLTPDAPVSDPRGPAGDPQVRVCARDSRTVRLELALFEADERSFPEFSYSQLVDNKINCTKEKVPLSRFEEEEKRETDEVAAISRKFENIYGGKPKKEDRIQDLIDIGFGYDEEDSFIDNSEAYDEFVPASITTRFGGFYVNSGVLHFRQASETEDLATEEETLEAPIKHEVNGGQMDKPKKKRRREGGAIIRNVDPKSSTLSENGPDDEMMPMMMMKKKRKKKAAGPLSVTSMLKKFQRQKEKERQMMGNQTSSAITGAIPIPLCPADAGGGGDPLLSLIGSTNDHALIQAANAVDFDIDLDSLLDVAEQTSAPKMAPQPPTEPQRFSSKADDPTQPDAAPEVQPPNAETIVQPKPRSEQIQLPSQIGSTSPHQCVPLPEGLPPRLEDSIRKLMAVAKTSEGESKLKFFTPEINSVLLDIEVQCREQGVQLRSKVYTHLSSFLPCSRDTLLKRVKKLFLAHTEEVPDVDDPMQKLKEAIGRAMPEQIACFNENCQVYEQFKTSKATEEEKEGKQKVNGGPEDNVEEKGGRRGGGPKKSFKWNEEIRGSLCEVLRVRMERYKKEGSQEMEHHLKTLLDNEVQPLWPKGWMQCRVLIRESRKMLCLDTSLPVKRARPEKKPPSIGGPPATSHGCSVLQGPPATSPGCSVLQGPPALKGLPEEADDVIIVSSSNNNSTPLGTEKKEEQVEVAVDAGSSAPAEANKPLVNVTSAQTQSLLDLLADQALAREQPHSVSQELLAAAVAKYKRSVRHWSFGADTKSPPLPPPPPQSSPVGFPLSGVGHVALPQLLQFADFARHMDASHVLIISDDDDDTMQ